MRRRDTGWTPATPPSLPSPVKGLQGRTKDTLVPQFRDGECEVRRLWDEAAAEAMGWDADEMAYRRALLHREPRVRGLGYNQYADAPEE